MADEYYGESLATDLNNELLKRQKREISEGDLKEIEALREERIRLKRHNLEVAGPYKRRLTEKLKDPDLEEGQRKRLEDLRENPPIEFSTFDLTVVDNELRSALKKDFEYTVRDDFGKIMTIKQSELLNKENPAAYILKKYKDRIKGAIQKAEDTNDPAKVYGLTRLLGKAEKNIESIEQGYVEEREEDENWEYHTIDEEKFERFEEKVDLWKKRGAVIIVTDIDWDEEIFNAIIKVQITPDYLPIDVIGEVIDIG